MRFWRGPNIAFFSYSRVHRDHGGPVARIAARPGLCLGKPVFEAFCSLEEGLVGNKEESGLYGNSHGTGTAGSKAEAVHRAVSEALERWAWHDALSEKRSGIGIELNSSTTGFAAFPGAFARSARPAAYFEAAERWCLGAWWEGKLSHAPIGKLLPWQGVNGIELGAPWAGVSVVVLWAETGGQRAYGFAGAASAERAAQRAAVELSRNIDVLRWHRENRGSLPSTRNEKRLVHFAGNEGRALFDRRVGTGAAGNGKTPRLAVDCRVRGPWEKFAFVWRCLFDPGDIHDTGGTDYFHF